MTWFKVDDRLHAHPKVASLESGPCFAQAVALWTLAGSWCASQLTDGHVPAAQLRRLVPYDARKAAAELVRVGLWEVTRDGFAFRSWDEYQPSRDEVMAKREASAQRQRESRSRRTASHTVTDGATGASVTLPRPDPTRPDPILSPGGESPRAPARETAAAHPPKHVERFERSFAPTTDAHRLVAGLVSETRQAAGGAPWRGTGWEDRDAVSRLVEWSEEPDIGPEKLRAALVAFWAVKGTGARLSYLVEAEPGRFLGQVNRAGRRGPLPANTHEEHARDAATGPTLEEQLARFSKVEVSHG